MASEPCSSTEPPAGGDGASSTLAPPASASGSPAAYIAAFCASLVRTWLRGASHDVRAERDCRGLGHRSRWRNRGPATSLKSAEPKDAPEPGRVVSKESDSKQRPLGSPCRPPPARAQRKYAFLLLSKTWLRHTLSSPPLISRFSSRLSPRLCHLARLARPDELPSRPCAPKRAFRSSPPSPPPSPIRLQLPRSGAVRCYAQDGHWVAVSQSIPEPGGGSGLGCGFVIYRTNRAV